MTAMYHDDREITAEKIIESLDTEIRKFTDIPDKDRLLLLLVVAVKVSKPSDKLEKLTEKLMTTGVLASIQLRTFRRLQIEAERIIAPAEDDIFLLTHLAAKLIALELGIDYRHPKLIAAFVGTVQSTLSTPLFETVPNTAELSLGLLGDGPKKSFPMSDNVSDYLRDLINIRLSATDTSANFFTHIGHRYPPGSTLLLDAPFSDPSHLLSALEGALDNHVRGRLVLIQNWSHSTPSDTWQPLLALIENRGRIEAMIDFSSVPAALDHYTAIIINTSEPQSETLYIDVSMSNKSLPTLDGIERMLLAGCIYNLWQAREPHSHLEYLSSGVRRFINSFFSEGFRPIPQLCNAVDRSPQKISKKIRPSRAFLRAAPGKLSRPARTGNSRLITKKLIESTDPRCIYVIGNNGEGKSFLLRDIVFLLEEAKKCSIGLPMSHADRFPDWDNSIRHAFTYKGASSTKIIREIGFIANRPDKVALLSECLESIGFGSRIYLMLKSELSYDSLGNPRRNTLELGLSDDMHYLASEPNAIRAYAVNVIREGHRTIPFDNLSSGEQSILGLLIKIIASDVRSATFLIDEPEISLHVSWQQRLPRIISLLSRRLEASFVIATHSPILIANTSHEDICYVSRFGELDEIPIEERHSVETLLLDGFETYTPHNREVHERCAKLVASLITAEKTDIESLSDAAIKKLTAFKSTVEDDLQVEGDVRQASDLRLIEKTLGAIQMLRDEGNHHG